MKSDRPTAVCAPPNRLCQIRWLSITGGSAEFGTSDGAKSRPAGARTPNVGKNVAETARAANGTVSSPIRARAGQCDEPNAAIDDNVRDSRCQSRKLRWEISMRSRPRPGSVSHNTTSWLAPDRPNGRRIAASMSVHDAAHAAIPTPRQSADVTEASGRRTICLAPCEIARNAVSMKERMSAYAVLPRPCQAGSGCDRSAAASIRRTHTATLGGLSWRLRLDDATPRGAT